MTRRVARWARSHLATWIVLATSADAAAVVLISVLIAMPGRSAAAVSGMLLLLLILLALSVIFPVAGRVLDGRERAGEDDRHRDERIRSLLKAGSSRHLPRLSQVTDDLLGVTPTRYSIERDAPYVARGEADDEIRASLVKPGPAWPFVIVWGTSKAGKSRTLAQALRAAVVGDPIAILPRDGRAVAELVRLGLGELVGHRPAVMVLDDLDLAGLEVLTTDLLNRVREWAVVAATMTAQRREEVLTTGSGVGAVARAALATVSGEHELASGPPVGAEKSEAERLYPGERFDGGIAETLVGARELIARYKASPDSHPAGCAVVRAAIDFRRAGVSRPVTDAELRRLFPIYVQAVRTGLTAADDQFNAGVEWATRPVASQVALLRAASGGKVAKDWIVFDHAVTVDEGHGGPRRPVPAETWAALIEILPPPDTFAVGMAAYAAGEKAAAVDAFRKAAASGYAAGPGILLGEGGDVDGRLAPFTVLPVNWSAPEVASAAKRWFRRLRRADDLSRLVTRATGASFSLSQAEFDGVRRLLEDEKTWRLLGQASIEDLAAEVSARLPPGEGRTAGDSRAAAMIVSRGLLEFTVADLDPQLFEQLLLTRLQRMETGQASALDAALLDLHADLGARFTDVMKHLKGILEQASLGPAGRSEVAVYLTTLIEWLNTDPWLQDRRFGGPVLSPAAVERKMRVTTAGQVPAEEMNADDLGQRCRRLVILGGSGSGKTWLAKRTARRSAEHALKALAAGRSLDEVELPLYTTCSRLFVAAGSIRDAAVSSALGQIGDLGGNRLHSVLREFLTERNAPTLLVIDSIDEAHGSNDRLYQADTLPWRIVLTSRPSSWRNQLVIDTGNELDRVAELKPLVYPDDVEAFIDAWFVRRPELGEELTAQIARRPDVQHAITVPLILAFYCIIGRDGRFPESRSDLYSKILRRMLTSGWRSDRIQQADIEACIGILRTWAWSAAIDDPVSGVAMWADYIPARPAHLEKADNEAVDQVATPLSPPNIDTGTTRRFIHRSLREYLVAEHVASLPVNEASEILLPHLWYDTDWEYCAPEAIAMHPQRDTLLRSLIRLAARSRFPQTCRQLTGNSGGCWPGWPLSLVMRTGHPRSPR